MRWPPGGAPLAAALLVAELPPGGTANGTANGTASAPARCEPGECCAALWQEPGRWQEPAPCAASVARGEVARGVSAGGVQVLGAFSTGTNLLQTMLQCNFPCQRPLDVDEWSERPAGLWKHTPPRDIVPERLACMPALNLSTVAVVAVVRSPFATLAAWRTTPYNLEDCVRDSWFLDRVKLAECSFPYHRLQANCSTALASFAARSLVDIWNAYVRGYRKLRRSKLFRRFAIVRYEDLVTDPSATVRRLAALLGEPAPAQVRVTEKPAKQHGHARARSEALDSLRSRRHLDPSARATVCGALDMQMLDEFGYADECGGSNVGWRLLANAQAGRLEL